MREILLRMRASLSPQVLIILAALMLILSISGRQDAAAGLEKRIADTLSSVDGAGWVEVPIRMQETESGAAAGFSKKTQSIPCGAVAAAQGADDPLVAIQLHDALCALLGLAPGAVSVIAGGR